MRRTLGILLSALLALGPVGAASATQEKPPPPPSEEPAPPPEPTPPPDDGGGQEPSEDFQRGLQHGTAYGEQIGRKKGTSDGKKEGDREGYAAGLLDAENGIDNPEDPGQPPEGGAPDPVLPPDDGGDEPPPEEPPPEEPPPEEPPSEEPAPSEDAEIDEQDIEAAALARYPELVPMAPSSRLEKAKQLLEDPKVQGGLQYSAGFAAGFAAGYGKAHKEAKEAAYKTAFRKGYRRGQADWRRRNTDENGNPLTPQDKYDRALAEYQRGRFREAADRFDMVLHGGQAGDLADKAMYGKANCFFRLKDYPGARKSARLLVETLPDSPLADDAQFLAIACKELHRTGGFFGIGKKADLKGAADEFESFLLAYPDSPLAPRASFRLGMLAAHLKQRQRAIRAYQDFLARWPDHPLAPKVRRRLAKLLPKR